MYLVSQGWLKRGPFLRPMQWTSATPSSVSRSRIFRNIVP